MAMALNDYLISHAGIDWSIALKSWHWLLPEEFTLWLVTRFADLFIVNGDGSVHMLDVGAGTLTRVAESRDDFGIKLDEGENANNWLMTSFVDELVATGLTLKPGQCYGFKTPPVLGGEYRMENVATLSIEDYLGGYGSIHEQLINVPEGTEVVLKVANPPSSPQ
jgi:hypothetical protein